MPFDFSTGRPETIPEAHNLGTIGHEGARALGLLDARDIDVYIDTTDATMTAGCAVLEMRSVQRLVKAARSVLCPMHEVSLLVTHFIGAVAAIPPDYSPSTLLNALPRLGNERAAWEAYGKSPEVVDRVICDLADEPMVRCLCREGTPEPPLTYINPALLTNGAVARLAQPQDEHAVSEWTQIRMDVEMKWLEPRIAVLAKIINHIVPTAVVVHSDHRMDALTKWQPDVDAVLTTLAGRKRWDVRGGWTNGNFQWPLYMRPTAVSDRLDAMLRADECLDWIRKQLGFTL